MNMVMSSGYSGSTHICIMEKNDVRSDKLYAFVIVNLVYLHLMWLRYSLSTMQMFIFHLIYVRYSLSAKIMKA